MNKEGIIMLKRLKKYWNENKHEIAMALTSYYLVNGSGYYRP